MHPARQERYLKGIQDPAIVVDHHRVSLLALEAWGTLRPEEEEGFTEEPC